MSEEICDKVWIEAAQSLQGNKPKIAEFFKTPIIKITDDDETFYCYNKVNWKDKGWCNVGTTGPNGVTWGICSESCRFLGTTNPPVKHYPCL